MDLTGRKIVVIGGGGFVGSHVVDCLIEEPVGEIVVLDNFVRGSLENLAEAIRDPRVRVVEGSITDFAVVRDVVRGAGGVFHLAALWLYECIDRPKLAIDVNIVGTYNVLEAAREAGVEKIVFSSSASVYGNAISVPMTEEHPLNNRTLYGATKIAGEQLCRSMYEQHRLDYLALRYMNIYGPRMDDRGAYVSVVVKVLDRIQHGTAPIVHGDGSQAYDFIHVEDAARANVLALGSHATDECLNIGTGTTTTVSTLVSMLLRASGSSLQPCYEGEPRFVTLRVGSTEKARRLIGFQAAIGLEEGLASVTDWHRRSAGAIRRGPAG